MVGLILVAHGNLANELLNTTAMILGEALTSAVGVPVNAMDDPESITDRIEQAIEQVNTGRGVLILTDMFGGTPSNVALSFHQDGVVDVISGMSLPMMLRFAESRDADSLSALAQGVKNAALESVSLASDLLSVKEADG